MLVNERKTTLLYLWVGRIRLEGTQIRCRKRRSGELYSLSRNTPPSTTSIEGRSTSFFVKPNELSFAQSSGKSMSYAALSSCAERCIQLYIMLTCFDYGSAADFRWIRFDSTDIKRNIILHWSNHKRNLLWMNANIYLHSLKMKLSESNRCRWRSAHWNKRSIETWKKFIVNRIRLRLSIYIIVVDS